MGLCSATRSCWWPRQDPALQRNRCPGPMSLAFVVDSNGLGHTEGMQEELTNVVNDKKMSNEGLPGTLQASRSRLVHKRHWMAFRRAHSISRDSLACAQK